MGRSPELTGVALVAAGSFNPAIFHPRWLSDNDLLAENEAEHALGEIVLTAQLTAFTADWLSIQVTPQQAVFSTVEEAHELELRDLVRGSFDLLPHTPVDAIGINFDSHYLLSSEQEWHAFGDRFVPKDYWEMSVFGDGPWKKRDEGHFAGMRMLQVEAWNENRKDFVRVEIAPSVRVTPWGVYVGINSHFQFSEDEERGNGLRSARAIADNWDEVRAFENKIQDSIMEAVS
jgi:hypothetical protein